MGRKRPLSAKQAGIGEEIKAAIVEAEKKFRRVQGWRDIEKLVTALKAIESKQEAEARRVA